MSCLKGLSHKISFFSTIENQIYMSVESFKRLGVFKDRKSNLYERWKFQKIFGLFFVEKFKVFCLASKETLTNPQKPLSQSLLQHYFFNNAASMNRKYFVNLPGLQHQKKGNTSILEREIKLSLHLNRWKLSWSITYTKCRSGWGVRGHEDIH
jgi:hypothetical protein